MGKPNPLDGHVSGQANEPMSKPAHCLTYEEVEKELSCSGVDGLSASEAEQRLEKYGKNELDNGPGVNPGKILLKQVANAMMLVLIMAMAVSFGIQSWIEGGVVAAIIILNIIIGFWQEFSAEKTMDSLRSLSSPTSHVIRGGNNETIPTVHVVPGDMVELKTGDTIPADIRLIEVMNFETDEALLTGESLPVQKIADETFSEELGPGDRLNIAFSSSTVTKGRARGVVFATGMFTEIGSIAAALRASNSRVREPKRTPDGKVKPHRQAQAWVLTAKDLAGHFLGVNVGTPLQRKLSQLAIGLFFIAVVFAIIVLASNSFSSDREVVIYAVATGLSMLPASLIVVLTITMSAGTKRMVERHVIVRKLNALEALGAVTDICSDKTGTLTQGKMVAKKAWIPSRGTYSVGESNEPVNPTVGDLMHTSDSPYDTGDYDELPPETDSRKSADELLQDNGPLEEFLKIASLANLATVYKSTEGEGWTARGDPSEIAILVFSSRFGWNRLKQVEGENAQWKLVTEYPFSSDVKKMSVIFTQKGSDEKYAFSKGAVERILEACIDIDMDGNGQNVELTEDIRDDILSNMEALASQGLRVLALASKIHTGPTGTSDEDRAEVESGLTFRGLIGLFDPPRPESKESVKKCHQAGIGVHMLTGDHPGTAFAIAKQIGIVPDRLDMISQQSESQMVTTAAEFDKLTDEEIDAMPVLPLVIARCAPNTKVRMIDALHRRKLFAAMTGDGVNDSPSLKRADVGIAMGQAGSDVAKDASDIILTDDNFASILNAVEEGRRIFDNIQKFVLHLLSQNIAQACTLLIGLAFKDSENMSVFPLSPVEIMWIIMITSGLPDMGLGLEIAAPDILQRPPQSLKRGIFTLELMVDMVVYGIWMAALCLASFSLVLYQWGPGLEGTSGCNRAYTEECDIVFRARATTFVSMTWFSLFLAWELINFRRSFFRMQPKSKRYFTQWMLDVWRNKFLFWSVLFGFASIFVILYVPVINHVVFLHTGITWEWGIVIVEAVLFFGGIEAWKWAKRVYFRRMAKKEGGGQKRRLSSVIFDGYLPNSSGESQVTATVQGDASLTEDEKRKKVEERA